MGRRRKYSYGPSLLETIEVGDVFRDRHTGRILTVKGKIYNEDMTISYRMLSTGARPRSIVSEVTLRQGRGFERIYTVPRTIIQAEKAFTGVFYGTARS